MEKRTPLPSAIPPPEVLKQNDLAQIKEALRTSEDLTQNLEAIIHDVDPLAAEMARIISRDVNNIKKDLWITAKSLNDGPIKDIKKPAPRYENSTFESVFFANMAAKSMAKTFNALQKPPLRSISYLADDLSRKVLTVVNRLNTVERSIQNKEKKLLSMNHEKKMTVAM